MPDNNTHQTSSVALVLIDVINHFEFPDGGKILKRALPMAARLARLKQRCRSAGIPAIYVNDNFGQWRSDARSLIARCLDSSCPGKPFVEQLRPDDEDYLVLKPMHSAFFQTPLEILLQYLGATSLILTGLATNSCIICTAHDAKMRFQLVCALGLFGSARPARARAGNLAHQRDDVRLRHSLDQVRVDALRGESRRHKRPKV